MGRWRGASGSGLGALLTVAELWLTSKSLARAAETAARAARAAAARTRRLVLVTELSGLRRKQLSPPIGERTGQDFSRTAPKDFSYCAQNPINRGPGARGRRSTHSEPARRTGVRPSRPLRARAPTSPGSPFKFIVSARKKAASAALSERRLFCHSLCRRYGDTANIVPGCFRRALVVGSMEGIRRPGQMVELK